MITFVKNDSGYIYALIDWEFIDKNNNVSDDGTEYLLVKYLWVHDGHRNNGCIARLIKLMAEDNRTKGVYFVGWERGGKHKDFQWHKLSNVLRRL